MFKASLKGNLQNKDLNQATCILPISVGQKYHEDEKFKLTIELINQTFQQCTIIVADTLGRHTALKQTQDETDEAIKERLLQAGDDWIKRNGHTLKLLNIPYNIVRWDQHLSHALYQSKRDHIDSLYTNDEEFKKAVDGSIKKFVRRYTQRQDMTQCDIDKAFADSLEYVKEECAVLLLWPDILRCDFLIYPNKLHEAMYNLRRRFIAQDNGDSTALEPLIVDFKKIKKTLEVSSQPPEENGHAYVPQFLAESGQQSINSQTFFRAHPPVNFTMTKEELARFMKSHIQILENNMSTLDAERQQAFLTYYLTHMIQLISPIQVTNNTDSSSESSEASDSERDKTPVLSPEKDPNKQPAKLKV